jgi:DUF1365 family protein
MSNVSSSIEQCAYIGHVVHKRLRPVPHALRYRVFSLLLDVDKLAETGNALHTFSYNRFNLFSLYDCDHGSGDGASISQHVRTLLNKSDISAENIRISMLCYPRILGYVFNPLTTYFITDDKDQLTAVIYEVSNTFGERTSYLLRVGVEQNKQDVIAQSCAKRLYVSPFNKVEGRYGFRITRPDEDLTVGVNLRTSSGPIIKTFFVGKRRRLSDSFLLSTLALYPVQSLKVITGIHYEALKLWLKGLRIVQRPSRSKTTPSKNSTSDQPQKKHA